MNSELRIVYLTRIVHSHIINKCTQSQETTIKGCRDHHFYLIETMMSQFSVSNIIYQNMCLIVILMLLVVNLNI